MMQELPISERIRGDYLLELPQRPRAVRHVTHARRPHGSTKRHELGCQRIYTARLGFVQKKSFRLPLIMVLNQARSRLAPPRSLRHQGAAVATFRAFRLQVR